MPNWCSNKLQIHGPTEDVERVFSALRLEENMIDFNGVVPMPPSLHITSGSSTNEAVELLQGNWLNVVTRQADKFLSLYGELPQTREDAIEMIENVHLCYEHHQNAFWLLSLAEGRQAIVNQQKYGHQDWYGWSVANWGTKWNGGQADVVRLDSNLYVHFDTAWSPPVPIIEALAEQYPACSFELSYCELGCWFAGVVYGEHGQAYDSPAEDVKAFAEEVFGFEFDDDSADEVESEEDEETESNT